VVFSEILNKIVNYRFAAAIIYETESQNHYVDLCLVSGTRPLIGIMWLTFGHLGPSEPRETAVTLAVVTLEPVYTLPRGTRPAARPAQPGRLPQPLHPC